MATRSLPARASLEHLKKEAKSLLKAHKEGNPDALATLEHAPRFAGKSADVIASAPVHLQECQHALACQYEFTSWASLKRFLEERDEE